MEKRKCWTCRKPLKSKKKLFCSGCEKKKDRGKPTAGTLIFYNQV